MCKRKVVFLNINLYKERERAQLLGFIIGKRKMTSLIENLSLVSPHIYVYAC